MKPAILLLPVFLFFACDKAEEKPASPAASQGADSKRIVPDSGRRTAVPARTAASTPQVATISEEEILAFTGKADELAQRWDAFLKLPPAQQTDAALKGLRAEHKALVVERGKILKQLTAGQRKAHIRNLIGSVGRVGSGILTYGLSKRRGGITPPTLQPQPATVEGEVPPPASVPQDSPVPDDRQPAPEPDNGGGVPDNAP